ncbi:MAG: PAS domain-containing protein [Deltaproteobacteria bacterium]|nr:PAS domain-containing protein [Deltaproteobacteria bacterium]
MDGNGQKLQARARDRLGPVVFDEVPCVCAVIDSTHRLVTLNRAFGRLFGERLGERCYGVIKGRDTPCPECVAGLALAEGAVHESDEQGRSRNGDTVSYSVRAVPLPAREGDPDLVVLLCTDTTTLRDLKAELSEAERLAEVGLTTALLAHTIKNLVTGLEGGIYVVDVGISKKDMEKVVMGWEMVRGYVDQVSTLVKNLLQLLREEGRPPEAVDPADLVRDAVRAFEGKAAKAGIRLEIDVEEGLPSLCVDRAALHDCLGNLVANAIDACTWDPDIDKEHRVTVGVHEVSDARLAIEVRDNGTGIAEENRSKILTRMFSTKGMRGTGLGLLLTRKAVERGGGKIEFESTEGRGTLFRIELPIIGEREIDPPPQEGVP